MKSTPTTNKPADGTQSASRITVINDGQVKYPVLTAEMKSWIAANGEITSANYDAFCSAVDCIGEKEAGTPGSAAMIQLCDKLVDAGAEAITLN
jgi:hypothetical protein